MLMSKSIVESRYPKKYYSAAVRGWRLEHGMNAPANSFA